MTTYTSRWRNTWSDKVDEMNKSYRYSCRMCLLLTRHHTCSTIMSITIRNCWSGFTVHMLVFRWIVILSVWCYSFRCGCQGSAVDTERSSWVWLWGGGITSSLIDWNVNNWSIWIVWDNPMPFHCSTCLLPYCWCHGCYPVHIGVSLYYIPFLDEPQV